MKQLVVIPSPPKKASRAPQGEERRAAQRRRAIGRRTGMELRGSTVDFHVEEEDRTGVERRQFRDRRRVPDRRIGVTIPANFFQDDD